MVAAQKLLKRSRLSLHRRERIKNGPPQMLRPALSPPTTLLWFQSSLRMKRTFAPVTPCTSKRVFCPPIRSSRTCRERHDLLRAILHSIRNRKIQLLSRRIFCPTPRCPFHPLGTQLQIPWLRYPLG
jgi:hypothetical protein